MKNRFLYYFNSKKNLKLFFKKKVFSFFIIASPHLMHVIELKIIITQRFFCSFLKTTQNTQFNISTFLGKKTKINSSEKIRREKIRENNPAENNDVLLSEYL